jgi:diaminopimelate epimerase
MDFVKMHGLGNDFIVVSADAGVPANAEELAVRLCDRHFGVGADGLVFIVPSDKADATMRIFNSDGSEPEQCGNAIRCVAKYLWDRSDQAGTELIIETKGAGLQKVTVYPENGRAAKVRVDMGEPILNGADVPVGIDAARVVSERIEADGRFFRFTAVSMGNPHCVIEVDDAAAFDVTIWGPKLETHSLFPRKTNVEFITVESPDRAVMRVWERGAGETLACGTGACAVLVASVLNGRMNRNGTVSLAGGDLLIEWDETSNRVFMTGAAEEVYVGEVHV